MNSPEWEGSNYFLDVPINFDSLKNPRIQVADLIARETMKGLDRTLLGKPFRESFLALAKAQRKFMFEYLMEGYLEGWLKAIPEMEKRLGFTEDDYVRWLDEKGLVDSVSSRNRFGIWLESQALRKKP